MPSPLLSLSDYKDLNGIPQSDVSRDTQLTALLAKASAAVQDYCRRTFGGSSSLAEYYDGNDTPFIVLKTYPVLSVQSVWEDEAAADGQNPDGAFGSNSLLVAGKDYFLRRDDNTTGSAGILERIGAYWPSAQGLRTYGWLASQRDVPSGNVKVQYTVDATVPEMVKEAVLLFVNYALKAQRFGGLMPIKERVKNYEYGLSARAGASWARPQVLEWQEILGPYVDRAAMVG